MLVARGDFLSPTAATTDTTLSLGFQPKGLLVYGTRLGADGNETSLGGMVGFASGVSAQRAALAHLTAAAAGTASTVGRCAGTITGNIRLGESSTSNLRVGAVSVWDTDVTIDWSSIASGTQDYFHYLALGGDQLSALAFSLTCPAQGASSAITGLGFAPDCVLVWNSTATTADPYTTSTGSVRSSLGWALRDGTQRCVGSTHEHGVSTTVATRHASDAYVSWLRSTTDLLKLKVTAWGADGFTVEADVAGATGYRLMCLALGGVQAVTGTLSQPTSTGAQVVSGTGITPQVVLLASAGMTAGGTENHGRFAFGVGVSDTSRAAIGWGDEHGRVVTDVGTLNNTYMSRSHVLRLMQEGATMTELASADLTSLDSGGFTLDWEAVDATSREVYYLVLGLQTEGLTAYCQEIEGA